MREHRSGRSSVLSDVLDRSRLRVVRELRQSHLTAATDETETGGSMREYVFFPKVHLHQCRLCCILIRSSSIALVVPDDRRTHVDALFATSYGPYCSFILHL